MGWWGAGDGRAEEVGGGGINGSTNSSFIGPAIEISSGNKDESSNDTNEGGMETTFAPPPPPPPQRIGTAVW